MDSIKNVINVIKIGPYTIIADIQPIPAIPIAISVKKQNKIR
jgi:hypothetical protein